MKRSLVLAIAAIAGLVLSACSDEAWKPGSKPGPGSEPSQPGAGGEPSPGTGEPARPGTTPGKPGTGTAGTGEASAAINLPPQLTGFSIESAVVPVGGTSSLELAVVDLENDPFYVWWRASCGAVSQDSETPGKAIFIAPGAPGECEITAVVQDAEMHTTAEHVSRILVTPPAHSEADDV